MKLRLLLLWGLTFATACPRIFAGLMVKPSVTAPSDVPLVANNHAATIVVDPAEAEVVHIAAALLAEDVERVTDVKPRVADRLPASDANAPLVLVGTVGRSALLQDLVRRGKLDTKRIEGSWESFLITTVSEPFPGVPNALVIAGSDRRGTAFGVFEISETIGVSPWVWWADVTPRHLDAIVLPADSLKQGPPSVKYRGIFLNDEDWGLLPWAAKTFEPEKANIGPKTYAKIFELLLRLKANFCWPAMHAVSAPFNSYPDNKLVADRYAIVMGSSHAEPMLRNNVGEWPHDQSAKWNPVTNLPDVLAYWEERVRENGRFENIYTVGMRGVHDSAMPGGGTLAEKRQRLEKVIGLQREMLARYVNPDPSRIPQIFCPYKEVLDIYEQGLTLPEDVTIVWPDDNHGYVRQLPNADERARSGRHGIYYHLSYFGRPHDYLWLDTTAPALIWHEMTKAYAFAADRLWVANVGDLKSIETGMTLFLQLAWDVHRYDEGVQREFLGDFYRSQFGPEHAGEIAALRDEFYRLCSIRRPEHLGFNSVYPDTPVQDSGWSAEASAEFLSRWHEIDRRAKAVSDKLPESLRDAYYELVEYPVSGGAAMAEKMLLAESARHSGSNADASAAVAAFKRIQELTARYNALGNGKWKGMMDAQPRQLPVYSMPPTNAPQSGTARAMPLEAKPSTTIDPAQFSERRDDHGVSWRVIEGLGPRGHAMAMLPHRDIPKRLAPAEIRANCAMLAYEVNAPQAGAVELVIDALPTHRLTRSHENVVAVSINDGDPVVVHFDEGIDDEGDPTWQRNVLRNAMYGRATLHVPQGAYTLRLWASDCGVVVQQISIRPTAS